MSGFVDGVNTLGLCVSRFSSEKMLFYGEKETWDQITPFKFSKKDVPPDYNSRKERVHREEIFQKCEPHERVVFARPSLRRGHKRKPCTKKDVFAEQHGTWGRIFTRSNIRTRQRSSLIEPKATPALTSKLLEEREFVVDSGASMHTLSTKDWSSDELEPLRRSRNPAVVVTANREVQTNEEAQVYVYDLGLLVTLQLHEDTLAVQSLGKLCEENGHPCEWSKRFKTTADSKWEEILMENG